ncbi:MAG: hypothetical protein ABIZ04_25095 [Opitutus sp.]
MKHLAKNLLLAAVLVTTSALLSAKDELPYTEGPVTEVSYIKLKPGMGDAYLKWLATGWKTFNEELKKAGIIIDAKVYSCTAKNPNEPDLILAVTYKNMAALDNLDERSAAIVEKVEGSRQKSNDAAIARGPMRDVLGSELIRELVLK